jgi:uncharacterized membrane protein
MSRSDVVRTTLRYVLAGVMVFTGIVHFASTVEFFKQLPTWTPLREQVVWISGAIEITLGLALAFAPASRRPAVGLALAALFVLVFPANVYQAIAGTDAFGLDTGVARWGRLLLQPVLIVWALWVTQHWPFEPDETPT